MTAWSSYPRNLTSLTPPGATDQHIFRYTDVDQAEEYDPPPLDINDPRLPPTVFEYNEDRQLEKITRPDGAVVDPEYEDGTGRLAFVETPTVRVEVTYHPTTGNVDRIETKDPTTLTVRETLDLGFDGPLPTSSTWSGTVSGSVSQTYDDFLRVDLQQVNGDPAHDVAFGYDDDGLLTQAGAEILTRDPDNGLLSTTTLGAVGTTQTYNNFGELDTFTATDGGGSPYTLDVDRDDLGRITRKEETTAASGTVVRSYEYDPAGRLFRVWDGEIGTGTLEKEYLYDANGNRLSEAPGNPTVIAVYDDQDRLTSYDQGAIQYTYTLAGDLETRTEGGQTTTYTYDALGNLVNVTFADGRQIEYVIDGQNRRIAKKACPAPCSNPTTEMQLERAWLYQDQLNPVAEMDDQGNVVARFVYGSQSNVPDYVVKGTTTYRVLSDQLGSPRVVVDVATAAVAQEISYDAWGNPTITGPVDLQPFGFAGGLYDPDTGLVRFGARDYDPTRGRWTTKDPIRFDATGTNLFGYSLDDPVDFQDSNGLDVINNSSGPVFVLPEEDTTGAAIVCLNPGGKFSGRQDALAIPGAGFVFKTTNFVNAHVGAGGVISASPGFWPAGPLSPVLGVVQVLRGGRIFPGPSLTQAGKAFEALLAAATAAEGECRCP